MKHLYTSDLHLGHLLICGIRGFSSTEEHDETIISNWNAEVRPGDIVHLLGDVALRWDDALRVKLSRLNGVTDLVTGNHDIIHPMRSDAGKHQQEWMPPFRSVQAFARRKTAGRTFLMSHFPYQGDHTPQGRYTQYRLRDEGMWLLHGHTHSKDKTTPALSRQVHAGLDAWDLKPVSEEELLAVMDDADASRSLPGHKGRSERAGEAGT